MTVARTVLRKHGNAYLELHHRILTWRYRGLETRALELRRELEAERIREWVKKHELALELRGWARRFLLSSSKSEAGRCMAQILLLRRRCPKRSKLRSLVRTLLEKREALLVHLDYPELGRTNNELEELIRQLQRQLKTMEGFGSEVGADGFLKLWMIQYWFKPRRCCRGRNRWKNGKSPLEMAGVRTAGIDWVRFSQAKNSDS